MDAAPEGGITELDWAHVPGTHAYQLLVGNQHFATMAWQRGSGSIAAVDSSEGRWTLKRRGFLWPGITVRDAATRQELAVLRALEAGIAAERARVRRMGGAQRQ